MTIQDQITHHIVRCFIHPFDRPKPIDFKPTLKQAKQVLISLPPASQFVLPASTIRAIIQLFPKKSVHLVTRDSKRTPKIGSKSVMQFPKTNIWSLIRNPSLKVLSQKQFDLFIDLDPRFSALNIYLCRTLRPSICIGLPKPHANIYYNFIYNVASHETNIERCNGLTLFLQTLMA